jgi:Predicted xylanase/chitin deacetylase
MKKFILFTLITLFLVCAIYAVEPENYIVIPRFFNLHVNDVEKIFTGNDLKVQFEYDYNNNPEGIVYSVVFYGRLDDENFHITPNSTVTLKVSLGKYYPKNANADSDKVIYLTFDDGPTKNNTYRVLDTLAKYDIKATFFFVGNMTQYYSEQVKSAFDAGHAIGCHSTTHKMREIYRSAEAFINDIRQWEDIMYDIIGELDYKIYRFPGGSPEARGNRSTYEKILEELHNANYYAFDWTLSNNDVWSRSRSGNMGASAYVRNSFLTQLDKMEASKSTSPKIVLLHETYDCTVDMLEWMIDILIERGYRFDTLDNLDGNWIS